MRIGMLTEGGYPYVNGEARLWCDRLVRGLEQHEFDIYALSTSQEQEDAGWLELPPQVMRVRTAPMWAAASGSENGARDGAFGRRARRRFAELYRELVEAVVSADATSDDMGTSEADRFANALYGLAELARDEGGLGISLRSEAAVRILERACRAPGALRAVRAARVPDLLSFAAHVERELRPLSLDWYEDGSGFDASGYAAGSGSGAVSGGGAGSARGSGSAPAPGAEGASGASVSSSGAHGVSGAHDVAGSSSSVSSASSPSSASSASSASSSASGAPRGLSGGGGLASVDLCHAASGGAAALPGLVAKHFYGVPLLVTEYGVQLRARYIAAGDAELSAPVRALLAAFHGRLAAEVYRQATVITPGNAHARRWQERCGADRAKLRTIHPGMEAGHFAEVGEREGPGDPDTLVWVGRVDPSKDLISLLHAFSEIRKEEPKARLRIVGVPDAGSVPGAGAEAADPAADREAALYLGHCKALAAQLFPDEAEGMHAVGENPVSFEELGSPEAPDLADVYGSCGVVVLSSVVEGFPVSLVEAMFCGRATVSTDAGAVVEVIGGTGLVVPPRNPRALAEACVALLRDPARRERLGAAARARALELFTVEQNVTAFHGIYLEIVSRCPVRREVVDDAGDPLPFAYPPEAHVPGRWTTQNAGDRGSAWPAGRSGGAAGTSWGADGGAREQLAGMTQGSGEADG
ncbi:DUF3492 domain-containing protein [Streptomyces sp. BH097]|uniref:DUF3492 domain-containing protein n=1 Tax=Streptomyces sp. BH097 TaxID=3410406 RepID=UPI003CEF7868